MWEDLPKKSKANKAVITLLIIVTLGVLGYIGYIFYKSNTTPATGQNQSPSPINGLKLSGTPKISPSPSIGSPSPSISPSAIDYKVPEGETYLMSSTADTNSDSKDETLVVTTTKDGKYHAYVLSSDGKSLFDNPDLGQKPLRIATQTYDASKESYLSWMIVFTEQSGNLAFIHWNGTQYEIPQNMGI